ncbi:MAG: type II toxin-antitoxin system VapC family toxin [Methanobacteriota archaeon]
MPDGVVVDASAVLDAASPGDDFGRYTLLQERFASTAPALLAWELGSVVHGRKAALFGASPEERSAALELLLAGIDLVPTDEAGRARTGALAARHSLRFYDASYLELAGRDDSTVFVTEDKRLLAAAARALGGDRATGLSGVPALVARAGL